MSVFSTRKDSDNQQLKKANPSNNISTATIQTHQKLPVFAKEYLEKRMIDPAKFYYDKMKSFGNLHFGSFGNLHFGLNAY